jgi:hypothetical protein
VIALQLRRNDSINLVAVLVDANLLEMIALVERMKVTKDLADFLLLQLLSPVISAGFCLATAASRKDHVFDELSNTWVVRICQNFGYYAFKESLILKFDVFFVLVASLFLVFINSRVVILLGMLRFRYGSDEAVDVGRRGIEFQGRMIFFKQLAHDSSILYEIN